MPTNSYDLIVLGEDPPGLFAAALAARRGLRVLWARTATQPASYRVDGYELPAEPLVLPGHSGSAARRVFEELHIQHPLRRRLREGDPPFQLAGPDLRLDAAGDDVDMERELSRELGDAGPGLRALERAEAAARLFDPIFSQDIAFPPTGFWERRECARAAGPLADEAEGFREAIEADARLGALARAPALLGGRASAGALAPAAQARALSAWRRGAPRVLGDWERFREIVLERFKTHGGEVRRVVPRELVIGWGGRAHGIRVDDGEELGAGQVIASLPAGELLPLCGKKPPKRLRQLADSARPSGYRYTLNFVVAEAGIPEGMGPIVFATGDFEAPLEGANAIALYVGEPDAEARAVVTAQAICPAPADGTSAAAEFPALRRAIRGAVEEIMPFLSRHLLLVHSPNEEEGHAEGESDLRAPIPAPPIWAPDETEPLGVAGLPYHVGLGRTTLACSQTLPGLGLEGDFVAGLSAAKLACAAAGKKTREAPRTDLVAGAS